MESGKGGSIGLYLYATEDEEGLGDEAPNQAKEEEEPFRGAYASTGEGGQDIYEVLDGEGGHSSSYSTNYEDVLGAELPQVVSPHHHGGKPRSLTNSIERIARSEPAEDEADAVYEFTDDDNGTEDERNLASAARTGGGGAGVLDGSDSNERFQRWMSSKDSLQKYVLLSQHARDFVHAASTFGRIIIFERHLPEHKKSIKPQGGLGYAGGEKFMFRGIMFKYALDVAFPQKTGQSLWMYGGSAPNDDAAMKAAANELRGINRFISSSENGLHYPLIALIDFLGYRLMAVSLVPIDKDTLMVGSSDGGKHMHAKDPVLMKKIKSVGKKLNLKKHLVCGHAVHTPGDLEGHKGRDGRYYVVDFGRCFPPETPDKTDPDYARSVFFKQLRPEFVASYQKPLSSDAYTMWQRTDPKQNTHNAEVKQACQHLYDVVIPQFCKKLDKRHDVKDEYYTSETHRNGICVRHFGRLREKCENSYPRKILLSDMIARVIKVMLRRFFREKMRDESAVSEVPYRIIIVEFLNFILDIEFPPARHWWTHNCENLVDISDPTGVERAQAILQKYPCVGKYLCRWPTLKYLLLHKFGSSCLSPVESDASYQLWNILFVYWILKRVQEMMCIRWSTHAWDDFLESNRWGFRFVEADIASFEARTKHMGIISLYEGTASLLPALLPSTEPREAIRLLRDARTHLFNAWQSNSDDFSTLRQLGVCNFELAQRIEKRWQEKKSATAASMRLSSSGQLRRLQDSGSSSSSEADVAASDGGDGSEASETRLRRHDPSATPAHVVPRQRNQAKTEEQKEIQMLAEQAVDNFKKAATIRPEDSMILMQLGLAHVMRARCRAQRQEDFYLAAQIFEERLIQGKAGLLLERVLYPALQSRGEELSGFLRMLYHSTPLVLFFAQHMVSSSSAMILGDNDYRDDSVKDDVNGESRASRTTTTEGVTDAIAVWESQQLTELKLSRLSSSSSSTTDSPPVEPAVAPELQQSGDKAFWGLLREEQKRDAAQRATADPKKAISGGVDGADDGVLGWCLDFAESGEVLTDPAVLTLQSLFDHTPRPRLHGLVIASMSFAGCDLLTDTSLASLFRFLRRTQRDANHALTAATAATTSAAGDAPQLGSSASVGGGGKQKRASEKPNKKQATLHKTAAADHNAEPQRTARVFPEEVDLAMCNITDATLLQIAGGGGGGDADEPSSSANNHRLRRIRLDGCQAVTGSAIAVLLARCPNLDTLAARDCPAIAWSKKTVTQALKQATQLRVLDVRGCDINDKWVQATKRNSTQLSILHSL